jgi:hypothetical protein
VRHARLEVTSRNPAVPWRNRHTVFEDVLVSRTGRMAVRAPSEGAAAASQSVLRVGDATDVTC